MPSHMKRDEKREEKVRMIYYDIFYFKRVNSLVNIVYNQ